MHAYRGERGGGGAQQSDRARGKIGPETPPTPAATVSPPRLCQDAAALVNSILRCNTYPEKKSSGFAFGTTWILQSS